MARIYDNWERLVAATLRREQLWQLAHAPSISSSRASDAFSSRLPDLPFDSSDSNSWYQKNPFSEIGRSNWGYNYSDFEAENSDEIKLLVPGDIFVNGEALNGRELNVLQNCVNPPKKLKPGNYWYDKYSGLWGKIGHKPSQIISANLDLGGYLQLNSSNGNTDVYINNREITKVELRLLKLAGVKCYRDMHFWLNEDGTYLEEASTPMKASIWSKPGMKLLCSLFSLPFPSKSSHTSDEPSVSDNFDQKDIKKLLLIGCSESGISTIFKQAIFLYKDVPFLEDEIQNIKLLIQSNIYHYIRILLEGRVHFEEESLNETRNTPSTNAHWLIGDDDANNEESIYTFGPRLRAFSDWLLHAMPSDGSDVFSASVIKASAPLWNDQAFQETLNRRSELKGLPSSADYFLKRAVDIFQPYYNPSREDILNAEGFLSSLSYIDFSFPPSRALYVDELDFTDMQDYMIRYQLIRSTSKVFGDINYNSFESEDVRMIIFTISLTDYDQFIIDNNGNSINKMMFNKECFESTIMTTPIYNQMPILLLLTKYDLFEEKITRIPLSRCDWFNDLSPVLGRSRDGFIGNIAEKEFHYVSAKFKELYSSLMGRKLYVSRVNCLDQDAEKEFHYVSAKFKELYSSLMGRKLYVSRVNCLDQDSVDAALKYAKDILKSNKFWYADYISDESF